MASCTCTCRIKCVPPCRSNPSLIWCVKLSFICANDVGIVGNLQNNRIAVHAIDGAVDAGSGDHLVSVLDRGEHLLHLLALPRLWQNHQEIHDAEHERQGDQKSTQTSQAAALPNPECRQIHFLLCRPTLSEPSAI